MCFADYGAFGYSVDHSGNDIHGAGAVHFDTKIEDGPSPSDEERINVGCFAPCGSAVIETSWGHIESLYR